MGFRAPCGVQIEARVSDASRPGSYAFKRSARAALSSRRAILVLRGPCAPEQPALGGGTSIGPWAAPFHFTADGSNPRFPQPNLTVTPSFFVADSRRNHYCGRQPPQKKTTAAHRRSRVPEPVARPRDHTFPRWTWRMRARRWRGDHSGGNRDHQGLLRGVAVTRTPALMFPSPFTIAMCYSARSPIG